MSVFDPVRRMRPWTLLLLIVCAFVALDRITAYAMTRLVLHSHSRIAQIYAGKARGDVLILGNSVAGAMSTAPLLAEASNRTVYTMAVHGLDARTQQVFVRTYLARNPAPKVAIMEVRSASDRNIIAGQYTMFAQASPDLITLANEQSPTAIPWRQLFALYNFNSREMPAMIRRVFRPDPLGGSGSNGRINAAKKEAFVRRRLSIQVSPPALSAFVATIKLLQAHGAKVIVVAAPMHPVTRKLGNWAEVYAATVRAALPPETIFLNALRFYNDDEPFEDPVHMNQIGRQRFSPVLADLIHQAASD